MANIEQKDSLIFCLIAKDPDVVLCEQICATGNFPVLSRQILSKYVKRDEKRMLQYDSKYIFHYWNEEGITVLALADTNFNKRVAFLFLEDVRNDFLKRYGFQIKDAVTFGMKDYQPILKEKMNYFNTNDSIDKLQATRRKVQEVKGIMEENLEKIMERGEKIEILVNKTAELEASAVTYRKSATKLKRFMCCRDAKMTLLLAGIIAVILIIIIVIIVAATA